MQGRLQVTADVAAAATDGAANFLCVITPGFEYLGIGRDTPRKETP